MMFCRKRKKKSDIARFSEPDFNIAKEYVEYNMKIFCDLAKSVSCFTERNSLRRSDFLKNSKVISLTYAFAEGKLLIPEGESK